MFLSKVLYLVVSYHTPKQSLGLNIENYYNCMLAE
jgi:hypothetical protein